MATFDIQKAQKDAEELQQELSGKKVKIAPSAIKSAPKKNSKPRKPRDGLCVMCKTYLFDESLGDCYCCGDVCAEEYVVKHKTTDAPAPDVGSSTQGGVKRKRRGEADVPSA